VKTYYVVFHKNGRVDIQETINFDESYVHIKTRRRNDDVLEYYAHKDRADFYKEVFA
jgi:hypothetical protein